MITCFTLKGDELKGVLGATIPGFHDKLLPEKAINEYENNEHQVTIDLHRMPKVSLCNLTHEKKNQTQEFYFGHQAQTKVEDIASNVIHFITDDENLQAYLYSEFHQSGIMQLMESAMIYPSIALNSKYATTLSTEDLTQLNLPQKEASSVYLQSNPDGTLKVIECSVFSDNIGNLSNVPLKNAKKDEDPTSPLFLSTLTLDIQLVDNPDAGETDDIQKKRKISIKPKMTVYVLPGKEALFHEVYEKYIDKFKESRIPIQKIKTNIQPMDLLDEPNRQKCIHDEIFRIYFKQKGSMADKIDQSMDLINFIRQKHFTESQLQAILNMKDPHGKTLLHYAYEISEPDIALHLLQLGADPNITDNAGYSFASLWNSYSNVSFRFHRQDGFWEKRKHITDFVALYNENTEKLKMEEDFVLVEKEPEPSSKPDHRRKRSLSFSQGTSLAKKEGHPATALGSNSPSNKDKRRRMTQ